MNIVKVNYTTTMADIKPGESFAYRGRTCMKLEKGAEDMVPVGAQYDHYHLAVDFDYNKLIVISNNEKVERIKASILVE